MMDELGREMTSAERLAVATGQMTIMDIVHGVALEVDAERDEEIYTVMPSGTVITRGELWREICATRAAQTRSPRGRIGGLILGVNASVNMFV
jgi:hypothetical protein